MLVSIVVPVYKVERYLRQCLDSILAQTFGDIEVIVVDDGSPDGCPAIIDEYAAKDSRVVAVHQPNGGYGKAVNAGIAKAQGKYIGIVESDDYIEPDMYERLVETAERTGADLTRCTFSIFDGTRDSLWSEVEELNRRDGDVINPHEELDYFLYHSAPWCYLYRRGLFDEIKLSESKGASYQDVTLVGEALLMSKSVAIVGRPLLHYRMENGQGSSCTGGGRNLMAIVDRCEELWEFMQEHGFADRHFKAMIVHKSIRAVNWFYERIDEQFRSEFFDRMAAFFAPFADVDSDVDWNAVPLQERTWLWTVVAGRCDLSHPVLLQHPDADRNAEKILKEVMSCVGGDTSGRTARLFGSLRPAFPECPRAIVCALDEKYLPYLSVCIASILHHASADQKYDIVVFIDFDLDFADKVKFDSMIEGRQNISIRFFDLRRHFTMPYFKCLFFDRHISVASYYRFAAPYVLFDYERCLWLDCDTVACEDVATLLDTDIGDCCVGGCRDLAVTADIFVLFRNALAYLKSLGFRHEKDYICSGVMLFNLVRFRRDGVVQKLLETCAAHKFRMHDQDGVNLVCQDSIAQLDGKWNFIAHDNPSIYPNRMQPAIKEGIVRRNGIWHFAGGEKPWYHPWRECNFVWWKYARMSPYYEEMLMDLSLMAAGVPRRRGLSAQRARARVIQAGGADPNERKIKYFLPYGFMCYYVRKHYGIEVDKPLFCSKNPFVILWRLFKFSLPYGLVIRIAYRFS